MQFRLFGIARTPNILICIFLVARSVGHHNWQHYTPYGLDQYHSSYLSTNLKEFYLILPFAHNRITVSPSKKFIGSFGYFPRRLARSLWFMSPNDSEPGANYFNELLFPLGAGFLEAGKSNKIAVASRRMKFNFQ